MAHCVECLSCGLQRLVTADAGECPRCHYVGWAPAEAVSEELRRSLRDIPVPARRPARLRLRVVAPRVRA